jgi:hypothetical protein
MFTITESMKKMWVNDAMCKATPVARRWAAHLMKQGQNFGDFEDNFLNVMFVEDKLYNSMKKSLVNHIERHGLDAVGLEFLDNFKAVKEFNFHKYEAVLRQVRRRFVHNEQQIEQLAELPKAKKAQFEEKIQALVKQNENLEYLISKINEFLRKVRDLNAVAFQMLLDGKSPDLESWSVQVVLNDNLFEENKQFLKQTLHHVESLEENGYKLGTAEIRLLLYHEQGCRRVKLYKMVESQIIDIFYHLQSEDERRQIYPEICTFVARLVPQVGYISPHMITFIFDRGFISEMSRNLLLNIMPVISQLNMTPLILIQLKKFFNETSERMRKGKFSETDEYVLEIMKAYSPKEISPKLQMLWDELKKSQTK